MTATMSSVLTTLVTNDINTVNRVKSDTDGEHDHRHLSYFSKMPTY